MSLYKHGTYGQFAESIGEKATQSGTVAVFVGVAPVNLVRGYADYVNAPVKLTSFGAVKRYFGYSENWNAFDLCEAFHVHFDNRAGGVGPIVAINVLNPDIHKKDAETEKTLTFVNGQATIASDTIILDTLVLAGKVEGIDYSVDYDYAKQLVIIDSLGSVKITGDVEAVYSEVDPTMITERDIIGGVTAGGVYSGLGCVALVYQELNLIPNLILCPAWSEKPAVYEAMVIAGTKINGHWDAFAYGDIPLVEASGAVDTFDAAIQWKKSKGYNSERTKAFWPQGKDTMGRVYHAAVLAAWRTMLVDATNNGVPMETPSNKSLPIAAQYFGENSKNRGFDIEAANKLNENGITTIVYWGGQWILWGPHTAAYKYGEITDNRNIFDNNIRMMMYVSNSFQQDHALTIDKPMTRAMKDTIKNLEQEKMDALAAMGAFIGKPVVDFDEADNSTSEMVEGNFTWNFKGTPTPPFKSGTLKVAYTPAGFDTYFGEE